MNCACELCLKYDFNTKSLSTFGLEGERVKDCSCLLTKDGVPQAYRTAKADAGSIRVEDRRKSSTIKLDVFEIVDFQDLQLFDRLMFQHD